MRKISSYTILVIIVVSVLAFPMVTQKAYSAQTTIIVPTDQPSIQAAINLANPGDTVLVLNGTYHEHIEINKTITLAGEDPANTIIDGDAIQYTPIILIDSDNATLSNITVRNTAVDSVTDGILVSNAQNVTIINTMVEQTSLGIMIYNSTHTKVSENTIVDNYAFGIYLRQNSRFNFFVGNTIRTNQKGIGTDSDCQNNTFYHNYFLSNRAQVSSLTSGNAWDNGYLSGGNYWSDYSGVDLYNGPYQNVTGSDGFGDTPYTNGVRDNYPLMHPLIPVPPVPDFTYSPTNPRRNQIITFNASNSYDPNGNITSYKWDFGDGNATTITQRVITHSYLNYASYTVTLTVTDNDNFSDSKTQILNIQRKTSALLLELNPATIEIGGSTNINGTLLIENAPPNANYSVQIKYANQGQTNYTTITTAITNTQGTYQYTWIPENPGNFMIQAYWEGNEDTTPSSSVATLNVSKKKSSLTLSFNPSTAQVNQTVEITGQLTAPEKEGQTVTISYSENYKPWSILKEIHTDTNGQFAVDWSPSIKGSYAFKASWTGNAQTYANETHAQIWVFPMNSSITLVINSTEIQQGSSVEINGKITPPRANVTVTLNIVLANATGTLKFTAQTDGAGYYHYVWNATSTGKYRMTAGWQGDDYAGASESNPINLEVKARPGNPWTYYVAAAIVIVIIFIALRLALSKSKRK